MYYIIYKITNNLNNKYYIGKHKTDDLDDGYMGSGKLIKRAIEKYGKENFTKEILFIFETEEEVNAKEKELVVVSEETYNLCPGGQGGFGYINKNKLWNSPNHSETSKQNAIKARLKYIEYNYANSVFRETRSKSISKALKSKIDKEGFWWNGRKHRPETIEKMKGHTNQTGSKNSQFGKKKTDEQKQKISESVRKTLANKKCIRD